MILLDLEYKAYIRIKPVEAQHNIYITRGDTYKNFCADREYY